MLHAATLELAKSAPIKQRLESAFSKHLRHIEPGQLPPALRCEFHELMRGLEAVPPMPGESPVHATVRKMSAEDADLVATRIVVLFGEVARASAPAAVELPDHEIGNFLHRAVEELEKDGAFVAEVAVERARLQPAIGDGLALHAPEPGHEIVLEQAQPLRAAGVARPPRQPEQRAHRQVLEDPP